MPYNPNLAPSAPPVSDDQRRKRQAEQEAEQQRAAKRPKKGEGMPSRAAQELLEQEESDRKEHIGKLQKKLGIEHLKDPEAMLFALIDRREVTGERLAETQKMLQARAMELQSKLVRASDPKLKDELQRQIEENSRLIFKLEDALDAIKQAGAADDQDQASSILDGVLMRGRDAAKGAEKAIRSMEKEQAQLEAELEAVYAEIQARESGQKSGPSALSRWSASVTNLMRRLSNQPEQAAGIEGLSSRDLTFRRREIQQRLNQLEMNLINLRKPQERAAEMWTPPTPAAETLGPEDVIPEEEEAEPITLIRRKPEVIETLGPEDVVPEEAEEEPVTQRRARAPRPMTAEEKAKPGVMREQGLKSIKLIESRLKQLEARRAEIDDELNEIDAQMKRYLKQVKLLTAKNSAPYNALRNRKAKLEAEIDQVAQESAKLMARYPSPDVMRTAKPEEITTTMPEIAEEDEEAAPEVADEDISTSEEAEPVSGVRRKPRAVPPPLPEAAKMAMAERAKRRKEAEEARQKEEAEAKEKAEFNRKVAWAEKLLPGGQAGAMNQDVLGQMGVNWTTATEQQRVASVEYVFRAAAVQEALDAGNDKAYDRAKAELQKFEKALGLVRSPYLEPAGRAGVGLTLESGRAEQARAAGRLAGAERTAAGRQRVRRTENLAEPIAAEIAETDMGLTAEEALERKEEEERSAAMTTEIEEERKKNLPDLRAKMRRRGMKVPEGEVTPDLSALEQQRATEAKLKESLERSRWLDRPMTIAESGATVKRAKEIWDLVTSQVKELGNSAAVLKASKETNEKDPGTAYVFALARYLEAVNAPAPNAIITEMQKRLDALNKVLGIAGNALVQSAMNERGKKFGRAAGEAAKRRDVQTTRQQQRRASGF